MIKRGKDILMTATSFPHASYCAARRMPAARKPRWRLGHLRSDRHSAARRRRHDARHRASAAMVQRAADLGSAAAMGQLAKLEQTQ